jgi:hypothetical protein
MSFSCGGRGVIEKYNVLASVGFTIERFQLALFVANLTTLDTAAIGWLANNQTTILLACVTPAGGGARNSARFSETELPQQELLAERITCLCVSGWG